MSIIMSEGADPDGQGGECSAVVVRPVDGLLAWVQAHFIRRYSDGSVVSHTEAVEELMEIIDRSKR